MTTRHPYVGLSASFAKSITGAQNSGVKPVHGVIANVDAKGMVTLLLSSGLHEEHHLSLFHLTNPEQGYTRLKGGASSSSPPALSVTTESTFLLLQRVSKTALIDLYLQQLALSLGSCDDPPTVAQVVKDANPTLRVRGDRLLVA